MTDTARILGLALGLLAVGWAYVPPAAGQEVQDRIRKLQNKFEALQTAELVKKQVDTDATADRESTVTVWLSRKEGTLRFRLEQTSRKVLQLGDRTKVEERQRVLVNDGTTLWREEHKGHRVAVMKRKPQAYDPYPDLWKRILTGQAEILEPQTVASQECFVLRIKYSLHEYPMTATYYISQEHGLVMKMVDESEAGHRTTEEVLSLKVGHEIDEAKFRYTPPKDARVYDLEAIKKNRQAPGG